MITELNKALSYVDSAEKRMAMSFFCCFGSSYENRAEEAITLYLKASTIFERESAFLEAAKCYEEVALLKMKIGEDNKEYLENSASCYSHIDKLKTEELLFECIKLNEKMGLFSKVADIYVRLAKLREESDLNESVIELYSEAARFYAASSQPRHEYNCQLRAADISVLKNIGHWKDSLELYEKCLSYAEHEAKRESFEVEIFFKISALYLLNDVS